MKTFTLDSSVLLKFVLVKNEPMRDIACKIIKEYSKNDIFLIEPSLWIYEILNTLSRKFSLKDAKDFFDKIYNLGFITKNINHNIILLALKIINKYPKISFYDASYHAFAIYNNSVFVTSDEKYYNKVKDEGSIILLEDFI